MTSSRQRPVIANRVAFLPLTRRVGWPQTCHIPNHGRGPIWEDLCCSESGQSLLDAALSEILLVDWPSTTTAPSSQSKGTTLLPTEIVQNVSQALAHKLLIWTPPTPRRHPPPHWCALVRGQRSFFATNDRYPELPLSS